jgi:hypothetical protein
MTRSRWTVACDGSAVVHEPHLHSTHLIVSFLCVYACELLQPESYYVVAAQPYYRYFGSDHANAAIAAAVCGVLYCLAFPIVSFLYLRSRQDEWAIPVGALEAPASPDSDPPSSSSVVKANPLVSVNTRRYILWS